jgi:hypothetical protein
VNKNVFRKNVIVIIAFYALAIIFAIWLRIEAPSDRVAYSIFDDVKPLIVAIPAAWFGYCLQRRQSYLKDVRDLWTKMVNAVQDCIQYTYGAAVTQVDYGRTLRGMSVVIDDLRAVFANLGEDQRSVGIYPFDELKEISKAVSKLGCDASFSPKAAESARKVIVEHWSQLRASFLLELKTERNKRVDLGRIANPYL